MYDVTSSLFWYRLIFLLELVVSESLFSIKLFRRSHFFLRVLASTFVLVGLTLAIPIVANTALYASFMFFLIFFFTILAMIFCFKESKWKILYCAVAAYSFQHIAYLLYDMAIDFVYVEQLLGFIESTNIYTGSIDTSLSFTPVTFITYFTIYFSVYWLAYYLFARKLKKNPDFKIQSTYVLSLVVLILFIDIYFNMLTVYNTSIDTQSAYLERLYNLLICFVALVLQLSQLKVKFFEGELATAKAVLNERRNQYELARENAQLLHVKVHDLKHLLSHMNEEEMSKEKNKINELIRVHESNKKTGNEALDIVLTEKSLICQKNDISLEIKGSGQLLSFMDFVDIYSLFGNALDNAIEASLKVTDKKRKILVYLKQVGNMVSISVKNYCPNNISFNKEGLINTTKKNKDYHGYGLLSIRLLVEKYQGTMDVDVQNGVFNLNLLLLTA